jgi:hypothetical protein
MDLVLGGLTLLLLAVAGVVVYRRLKRKGQAPSALLGVADAPETVTRGIPAWYVPLSPVEDEEYAWQLDHERRKGMEKNA